MWSVLFASKFLNVGVGAKKGNQECAAIYDKCIDELVEFISGETTKKKRRN